MSIKCLRKINKKLQFLYRRSEFLNPKLCRSLCNCLIEPCFNVSGESMPMKSLREINTKLQFLYRQYKFQIQNCVGCCLTV